MSTVFLPPWLNGRLVSRALLIAEFVVIALMCRNWAYVTTYRLYLERRIDNPAQSAAAQRFDIDGRRVVPRIVTRGPDRIAFSTNDRQDSELRVDVQATSPATYSIWWRNGSADRTLASGTVFATTTVVSRFPTGTGTVELRADNAVTWIDPRVVRGLRIGQHFLILAILLGCSWFVPSPRTAWFKAAAIFASAFVAVFTAELTLRAMGDLTPSGIATERHDLGEVTWDPRWEDSARYGRRLRAHADTLNEWNYGDIVRMGFVPPAVSGSTVHRFRFVTDGEGFRNRSVRDRFEIAALGDSFTDAMTMTAEASWPVQLEQRLGVRVQNYGTSGFGPQQELLVLKDFVARHRPSRVVLAYFAGNDLFDAEGFDDFQRSGGHSIPLAPGWRIKDVVSRADTWYVVSALKAGLTGLARARGTTIAEAAAPQAMEPQTQMTAAPFDRGMFAVPVNGRVLRWAFMPPYLNTLNFSRHELESRRGWSLTRNAILEMQRVTRAFGGEFVLMFLPFKSQVYWPLLERTFSRDDLRAAMQFYLDSSGRDVDLDAMHRNRLAQNRMLQQLCEEAHIPFLDTTDALRARVDAGENVYFPDESHLNEAGEAIVADVLARFLSDSGSFSPKP